MNLTKPKACYYYAFCFFILSFFTGCKKDTFNTTNNERPAPGIMLSTESNVVEAYEGQMVNVTISLEAQAGIAAIRVSRGGQLLETIEGTSGQVGRIYAIQYLVPEGAISGDKIVYLFVLEDKQGRRTEQSLTIQIIDAPPIPDFEFEDITIGGNNYKLINLDINRDVTLSNDHDYLLRGKVAVIQGAVLTIEEGTTIYADGADAALLITTGTKIMAEGTAAEPIVFTSLAARTGSGAGGQWLGLFIHGLAPVTTTHPTIISDYGQYGGADEADDSGSLKYVEIAYAGAQVTSGTSTAAALVNGALNLNAVGSGTQLEHIYVNRSGTSRTGVSISGGTVKIKYLFVDSPQGRALLWKAGYSGLIQFFVATYSDDPGGAYTAIDGYGNVGALGFPVFSNVSIQGGGQTNTRGIRIRDESSGVYTGGAKVRIYNCWINGTGNPGLRTDATNDVLVAHSRIWGNGSGNQNFHSSASGYNSSASPYFNNTTPVTITEGYKGVDTNGALDPVTLDSWFSPAPYIGAVDPGNDWTGWWN